MKNEKKELSENRVITIRNAIEETLEEKGEELNDWEVEFLENIQKQIKYRKDLTRKQWEKLLDIVEGIV